eukprot:451256_1
MECDISIDDIDDLKAVVYERLEDEEIEQLNSKFTLELFVNINSSVIHEPQRPTGIEKIKFISAAMLAGIKQIQISSDRLEEHRNHIDNQLHELNDKKQEITNDIDKKLREIIEAVQIQKQQLKYELHQTIEKKFYLLQNQMKHLDDHCRRLTEEYNNINEGILIENCNERTENNMLRHINGLVNDANNIISNYSANQNLSTNIIADIDVNGVQELIFKAKITHIPTEAKMDSNPDVPVFVGNNPNPNQNQSADSDLDLNSPVVDEKNDDDVFIMIGVPANAIK